MFKFSSIDCILFSEYVVMQLFVQLCIYLSGPYGFEELSHLGFLQEGILSHSFPISLLEPFIWKGPHMGI